MIRAKERENILKVNIGQKENNLRLEIKTVEQLIDSRLRSIACKSGDIEFNFDSHSAIPSNEAFKKIINAYRLEGWDVYWYKLSISYQIYYCRLYIGWGDNNRVANGYWSDIWEGY